MLRSREVFAEAQGGEGYQHREDDRQAQERALQVVEAGAAQGGAADDLEEVGERQGLGEPLRGNMNPLSRMLGSRMLGSRKKKDICIVCCWVFARVEKKSPSARLAAMKPKASA